jgi:hypothetical protein
MEKTFSSLSVPRCNKQDQLGVAVRELLGFSRCEKIIAEARRQFGNPEEGERPPLEAVTRKLAKT